MKNESEALLMDQELAAKPWHGLSRNETGRREAARLGEMTTVEPSTAGKRTRKNSINRTVVTRKKSTRRRYKVVRAPAHGIDSRQLKPREEGENPAWRRACHGHHSPKPETRLNARNQADGGRIRHGVARMRDEDPTCQP
jgi:hypothetical protein